MPDTSLPPIQRLDTSEEGVLAIVGEWTLAHYDALCGLHARLPASGAIASLDFSSVDGLDTAGAALLAQLLGPERLRSRLYGIR